MADDGERRREVRGAGITADLTCGVIGGNVSPVGTRGRRLIAAMVCGSLGFVAGLIWGSDDSAVTPVVFGLMVGGLTYFQLWAWKVRDERRARRRL